MYALIIPILIDSSLTLFMLKSKHVGNKELNFLNATNLSNKLFNVINHSDQFKHSTAIISGV